MLKYRNMQLQNPGYKEMNLYSLRENNSSCIKYQNSPKETETNKQAFILETRKQQNIAFKM